MANYAGVELVQEFDGAISDTFAVRLYRSPIPHTSDFRFHIGLAVEMVKPILGPLETVWGAIHWKRDGKFYLWASPLTGTEPPRAALQKWLRTRVEGYNRVVKLSRRFSPGNNGIRFEPIETKRGE